mmetsp:Transcript_38999/g.51427  ORF Transcript_38999/g.51427 Transcript_38999/m.51427 type:complete len:216 (-) Transcript_38999:374-1021(-)
MEENDNPIRRQRSHRSLKSPQSSRSFQKLKPLSNNFDRSTTTFGTIGQSQSQTRFFEKLSAATQISPELVGPVPARKLTKPRSPGCKSSTKALKMTTLDSEPSLNTWSIPQRDNVFMVSKMKFQDPQAQRAHAAREISLEPILYKDPVLFQYGILPDQYIPRMDAEQVHPVDWLDATLPNSLTMQEAKKRDNPPWDGTRKNIVREKLWRPPENIT